MGYDAATRVLCIEFGYKPNLDRIFLAEIERARFVGRRPLARVDVDPLGLAISLEITLTLVDSNVSTVIRERVGLKAVKEDDRFVARQFLQWTSGSRSS